MELVAKNLKLRPEKPEDFDQLLNWFFDYRLRFFYREWTWLPDESKTIPLTTQAKQHTGSEFFVIADLDDHPIGLMTYFTEKPVSKICKMGILLDPDFQGKSHAIEAIIQLLRFLFVELKFRKVVVEFSSHDEQILRITEKGGFVKEGLLRNEIVVGEEVYDEWRFGMMAEEFLAKYGAKDDVSSNN